MWRYSREGSAGYNAVAVNGVGTIVRHNHMHVGQYDAVKYQVPLQYSEEVKSLKQYFVTLLKQLKFSKYSA